MKFLQKLRQLFVTESQPETIAPKQSLPKLNIAPAGDSTDEKKIPTIDPTTPILPTNEEPSPIVIPVSTYNSPRINNHLITVLPQLYEQARARALSRHMTPELLALAVQDGLLPPTQAWLVAENQPDPAKCSLALHLLSQWSPPDSLSATWAGLPAGARQAAHQISELPERAQQLARVGATNDAIAVAKMIAEPASQADTLAAIGAWQPALQAIATIEGLWERSDKLRKIAPKLPPDTYAQAIRLAQSMQADPRYMADALCVLIPFLSQEHKRSLHTWAFALEDTYARVQIGGALLTGTTDNALVEGELEKLAELANSQSYQPNAVKFWTFLLPALSKAACEAKLPTLLSEAREIRSPLQKIELIGHLMRYLPPAGREPIISELITLLTDLSDNLHHNRLWGEWAIALIAQNEPDAGLALLHHTDNEYLTIGYLREGLPYLKELPPENWIPQVAQLLPTPTLRNMFWQDALPVLSAEAIEWVWRDIQAFDDASARRAGKILLAPHRPAERRELVRSALEAGQNRRKSGEPIVLASLARHYPAGASMLLEEALDYLEAWDTVNQAYILVDMLAELGDVAPAGFINHFEQTVAKIEDEQTLRRIWLNTLPHAPASLREAWRERIFQLTLHGTQNTFLDQHLHQLIPHLSDEQFNQLFLEALSRLSEMQVVGLLNEFAERLNPAGVQTALDYLSGLPQLQMSTQAGGIVALAPYLTEAQLQSTKALVAKFLFPASRIQAQAGLASRLGEPSLTDLLEEARKITIPASKMAAFIDIAPYLPAGERTAIVQEALTLLPELDDDNQRSFRLLFVMPLADEVTVGQLVQSIRQIDSERQRSQLLRKLIPHMPTETVGAVLPLIAELGSAYDFDPALALAITHLPPDPLIEALLLLRERAHDPTIRESLSKLVERWPELADQPALDLRTELVLTLEAFTQGGLLTFLPAVRAFMPQFAQEGMSVLLEIRRLTVGL